MKAGVAMRQKNRPAETSRRTDFSFGAHSVPHSAAAPAPQGARNLGDFVVRNAAVDSTATAAPAGTIRELKVR